MRYVFLVAILSLSACASVGQNPELPAKVGFMIGAIDSTPKVLEQCGKYDPKLLYTYQRYGFEFEVHHQKLREITMELAERTGQITNSNRASMTYSMNKMMKDNIDTSFGVVPDKVEFCRLTLLQCKEQKGICTPVEERWPEQYKEIMRASVTK